MSFQRRFEAAGTLSRVSEASVEASFIPSDPQRRKPDDQTCGDGVVEPSTGDGWPIKAELCADELVVGGGVGWSDYQRRRRAAQFSSAAAAPAASNRMREH